MPQDKPVDPTESSLGDVKKFFGFVTNADFLAEWKQLTDEDKHEIRVLLKNLMDDA